MTKNIAKRHKKSNALLLKDKKIEQNGNNYTNQLTSWICAIPPLPSEDIFFSLCKGKSLFPNGLGIQYGFRKIFLSLLERVFDVIRTKASDCLSSSSTFVWHREKKSPDGKEHKSSKPKGNN